MLLAVGLGLLIILVGPLVSLLSERLFAPVEVGAEFTGYLAIRLFGAPAALANMVLLGWLLGLQDSRRPLLLMILTNGINAVLAILFVFGFGLATKGVATATVLAEYAGLAIGLVIVRGTWRRQGGWPGWPAIMVLARFRRLLAVNRDLFLRSLLLEAAFVAFAAIGSRQGEVVLAANAVLMNFFTAAAWARRLRPRCRGHGRAYRRCARPAGFRAAVRASFVAALLAVVMTWPLPFSAARACG